LERPIIEIKGLTIQYPTFEGPVKAVEDFDLSIKKGEVIGLVGESGCGKSTLGLAIQGLLRPPGKIVSGEILFRGEDIVKKTDNELRKIRGRSISMVFQDPMTSLNPLIRVDKHFFETIKAHEKDADKKKMVERIEKLIEILGISSTRLHDYPHQLSGGMRQRVMIGLGLILNPEVIVADEPTNSLDVIVEAHFLDLLKDLKKEYNLTIILITHNMGIVAELATRVVVMYAGRLIESGNVMDVYGKPLHPYTQGLLASIPNISLDQEKLFTMPGSPPDLISPPSGCTFHPRCSHVMKICKEKVPHGIMKDGRIVECFLYAK